MSGYRGDGYGQHGDVGDDDFRFGDGREQRYRDERDERDERDRRGAAHGNLMGRAEHDAAAFFRGEGDDPRARQAADDHNRRFGREDYEGSYAIDPSYQSYRERHLAELDRDYDEWCRDREQQFHREFHDWRSRRQHNASNQPGQAEMIQSDRNADTLTSEVSAQPARTRRARP